MRMEVKNGVSDSFGKLMARQTGGSTHSTQQCKFNKPEIYSTPPYMAESCGGCDDHNEALFGFCSCKVVGG